MGNLENIIFSSFGEPSLVGLKNLTPPNSVITVCKSVRYEVLPDGLIRRADRRIYMSNL